MRNRLPLIGEGIAAVKLSRVQEVKKNLQSPPSSEKEARSLKAVLSVSFEFVFLQTPPFFCEAQFFSGLITPFIIFNRSTKTFVQADHQRSFQKSLTLNLAI